MRCAAVGCHGFALVARTWHRDERCLIRSMMTSKVDDGWRVKHTTDVLSMDDGTQHRVDQRRGSRR